MNKTENFHSELNASKEGDKFKARIEQVIVPPEPTKSDFRKQMRAVVLRIIQYNLENGSILQFLNFLKLRTDFIVEKCVFYLKTYPFSSSFEHPENLSIKSHVASACLTVFPNLFFIQF